MTKTTANKKTTHFGFEPWPKATLPDALAGVFNSVQAKYDIDERRDERRHHPRLEEGCMDWLPRVQDKTAGCRGRPREMCSFKFGPRGNGPCPLVLDLTEPMLVDRRKPRRAAS